MNDDDKDRMKKDGGEETETSSRAAKNDGPDETPVYEDLYHDEGRRNVLDDDEDDEVPKRPKRSPGEKGDDL